MSFIALFSEGSGNAISSIMPIIMIVLLVVMIFFMYRSNKKQERQANDMRNNLEVGDEVTTIGGIVGEIVSIKDETVTIETSKDRTKIRFLKTAIRNVDVSAAQKRGEVPMNDKPEKTEKTSKIEKAEKVDDKKDAPEVAQDVVEEKAPEATEAEEK